MEIQYRSHQITLLRTKMNGKIGRTNLGSILKLDDSKVLCEWFIAYLTGKTDSTVSSWINRIKPAICKLIDDTEITRLPNSSHDWRIFIQNLYGITLTSKLGGNIKTRVDIWNKNIRPFLLFIQMRDYIPVDVTIPRMKNVGEVINNSSFTVKLIGEKSSVLVKEPEYIYKLLTPVSLSRTDAQYLDELSFDLDRKRDKLYSCLYNYWQTIKEHYDFGQKLITTTDKETLLKRIECKDIYDYTLPSPGKQIPPHRRHIAKADSVSGLGKYLTLLEHHYGVYTNKARLELKDFPRESLDSLINKTGKSYFPESRLEDEKYIGAKCKINWCLGSLSTRDTSYIMALLIMLNPKFTPESLLFAKILDKNGKTILKLEEIGCTFSIDKERAKSEKKEKLDDVSLDIISTVIKMNSSRQKLFTDSTLKKSLFITVNQEGTGFVIPAKARVSSWLTGYTSKKCPQRCLNDYFPSLDEVGLVARTITHSKLRHTEGVLEFFRTGSIRSVSRKLGNSNKVVLEHYLPKELIAAWNTRQVRRFQNLLIVSAVNNEDYLLEAVDFNTLSEVHDFITDMISTNTSGKNPLINYLTENSSNNNSQLLGKLIASISTKSLTSIYLYRKLAQQTNIEAKILAIKDNKSQISPLSIIMLSIYLSNVLEAHSDSSIRSYHKQAIDNVERLKEKINWSNLFVKRGSIA